jgi:protease-4
MSTVSSKSEEGNPPPVVIHVQSPSIFRSCLMRIVFGALVISVLTNFFLLETSEMTEGTTNENFVSGDESADDKIAIIPIVGMIMPPFTERVLGMIEAASEDDDVKGVILSIDSPGGLVTDSHQMYHRLKQLAAKKPIYVSMKRMCASGGVYAAMGAGESGKIFAEPTTWTGSIGVIIPRYDFTGLGEKFGVASDSLTTGEFKDSLNPLKPVTDREREVWGEILEESFARFVKIVAEGRKGLDEETVRTKLATGQIFTADQAVANGLIDDIKFEDEVIETLQKDLALAKVRVIKYDYTPTTLELLLGSAQARQPENPLKTMFDNNVPRAMYYFGWGPSLGQPGLGEAGLFH